MSPDLRGPTQAIPARHRLDELYPPGIGSLPVAWRQIQIPGAPRGYGLTGDELDHPDPRRRFGRRAIQFLSCRGPDDCETLALIDKASPHSQFDLMLSEVSAQPRSTAAAVRPTTGLALWRSGLNFVAFCSDPEVVRRFGLAGGELHLALNCDPYTQDRESVQAAKQFHLHLLYWDAPTLAPLAAPDPFAQVTDPLLRRQALDPITFLGAQVVTDHLVGFDLGLSGARLLAADAAAVLAGERPLGALIELPGWGALGTSAFEDLIRRLHLTLESLAARLLAVFTGARVPPPPWQRHPLRPLADIEADIAALPMGDTARAGLSILAAALGDLRPATALRLAGHSAAQRMNLMTLNQPCYAINLHAQARGSGPLIDAPVIYLIIQPKLFSGIGGAGLLNLGSVASVRIRRAQGSFSPAQWRRRARFQAAFAQFNQDRLAGWDDPDLIPGPIRRFAGPVAGWVDDAPPSA